MARRSSVALGITDSILVLDAAGVGLALAPNLTRFPEDTDMTFDYSGTASLLNAAALQAGDMSQVFLSDAPITIERRIKVEAVTGNSAAVGDTQVLKGKQITVPSKHTYAIGRSSLRMRSTFGDTKVEAASGCLAIGFPLAPKANDSYTFYDPSTQKCFKANYKDSGSVNGRDVYNYTVTATAPSRTRQCCPACHQRCRSKPCPASPVNFRWSFGTSLAWRPHPCRIPSR